MINDKVKHDGCKAKTTLTFDIYYLKYRGNTQYPTEENGVNQTNTL